MTLSDDEIERIAAKVWDYQIKSEIVHRQEPAWRTLQAINTQVYGGPVAEPLPATTYTVVRGDTFNDIAARYGLAPEVLQVANPQIININLLNIGDVVNIPSRPAGTFVPASLPFQVMR